jgi:hypothetical protein
MGCRRWRMRVKRLGLIIILIRDAWGFYEITGPRLISTIAQSGPDYYCFANPGALFIYFKVNPKNLKRSKLLINEAIEFAEQNREHLDRFEIGHHEGEMACIVDLFGRIVDDPMGEAGNAVYMHIVFQTA